MNDRLEEAENDLRKTEKDSADEDLLVHRLNDLLNDLNNRNKKVKQPEDQTDGVGQRLADVHKKYLELVDELEKEKQHGNLKQKQVHSITRTSPPFAQRLVLIPSRRLFVCLFLHWFTEPQFLKSLTDYITEFLDKLSPH